MYGKYLFLYFLKIKYESLKSEIISLFIIIEKILNQMIFFFHDYSNDKYFLFDQ